MTKLELINLLSSCPEDEVVIVIDNTEYEISTEIEHVPEHFDGFFTAYPALIGLKPIMNE